MVFNIKTLLIGCLLLGHACLAQKKSIKIEDLGKWPIATNPILSNNGSFIAYTIHNQPIGSATLVVSSSNKDWETKIIGGTSANFTKDSRNLVFQIRDSLGIINLGNSNVKYFSKTASYKLPKNGIGKWLAYQIKGQEKELVLNNLSTGIYRSFKEVKDYYFTDDGNGIVIQTDSLKWIDLNNGKAIMVWDGVPNGRLVFDKSGTQVCFVAEERKGEVAIHLLWHYKRGNKKINGLADDHSSRIKNNLIIGDISRFSSDGKSVFFSLRGTTPSKSITNIGVDIWSYTDPKLQSQQLMEEDEEQNYDAILHLQDKKIIQLVGKNEEVQKNYFNINDEYRLIANTRDGDLGSEWNWNKAALSSVYLVNTKDGSRKLLKDKLAGGYRNSMLYSYLLSPKGRYVLYYDALDSNYFSYEIATGRTLNLTKGLKSVWTEYTQKDIPSAAYVPIGLAGWVADKETVLIYDRNDIYQVDLSGKQLPINLTKGKAHNLVYRLALVNSDLKSSNEKLILSVFNRDNKHDGFASLLLNSAEGPKMLYNGPYLFAGRIDEANEAIPIKARDVNAYLVRRTSASEAENYFLTYDFKTLNAVTSIHPENNYNWLTSELISYKTQDGIPTQGILYKPEDFDPNKKYPIIFYYYERFSETLNQFLYPTVSSGPINIPYYVSNGYMVCVPDIHYKIGEQGKSALNSVVAAANYLIKRSYIDSTKMGLQGHSRGGFETNYIITHSNVFAAAMSASGYSDFVSMYGGIRDNGTSRQSGEELNYQRTGATLWQRPDLFIENSPVFNADKVTTPLLMMNNIGDRDIPFMQGVEFFTALRRLGKRAWMLQYDGGDHMVFGKQAEDLTIRMKQFFDHYLMDKPAPKWMTRGIPAKMKGTDDGLELDYEIKTPGPGLLTDEEQKKVDAYSKIPLGEKLKPLMKDE
jgi:dipeptidyl aminopeptidase/acylaminoacyl peptidase